MMTRWNSSSSSGRNVPARSGIFNINQRPFAAELHRRNDDARLYKEILS